MGWKWKWRDVLRCFRTNCYAMKQFDGAWGPSKWGNPVRSRQASQINVSANLVLSRQHRLLFDSKLFYLFFSLAFFTFVLTYSHFSLSLFLHPSLFSYFIVSPSECPLYPLPLLFERKLILALSICPQVAPLFAFSRLIAKYRDRRLQSVVTIHRMHPPTRNGTKWNYQRSWPLTLVWLKNLSSFGKVLFRFISEGASASGEQTYAHIVWLVPGGSIRTNIERFRNTHCTRNICVYIRRIYASMNVY